MHKRNIGETKDGVTDVESGKPTPAQLKELSATIAAQALVIAALAGESALVAKSAKDNKNPMVAAKITKEEQKALLLEEINYQRSKEDKQILLEEKRIKAIRDVAIAQYENTPQVTYIQFVR
ncbi:MAG: hypothetical protein R3Y38_07030 [Rikenellaceae bacterium]